MPCVLTAEQQQTAQNNGDTVQIFQKTTTGKYNSNNYELLLTDTITVEEEESIEIYGGFYIAKYEAGIEGTKDNDKLGSGNFKAIDGTYKPLSQPNVGVWNHIKKTEALRVSKAMIENEETGVHSTLISGEAWDTTLQWITNTVDECYAENSTDKGNYIPGSIAVTGSNPAYSKNNIYDMAGNVMEWTTERCKVDENFHMLYRGRILPEFRLRVANCVS